MTASSRAPGNCANAEPLADRFSFERQINREWLLTSGLGGFAMGTAAGVNIRRYHGLLIAATMPPVRRILALHSVMDRVTITGQNRWLAAAYFAGAGDDEQLILHPDGWRRLISVKIEPTARVQWEWRHAGGIILRTLALVPGRNAARLTYTCRGMRGSTLALRPLTPLRDFHELELEPSDELSAEVGNDRTIIVRRGELALRLRATGGSWSLVEDWWRRFAYTSDRDRGQAWIEDVWSPGELSLSVDDDDVKFEIDIELTAPSIHPPALRAIAATPPAAQPDHMANRLRRAAGQFIVRRRNSASWAPSIIAGYPWFSDWGRDSMISLEGLLLIDGRFEEVRDLLRLYAAHLRRGLIPNRFDDWSNEPHYNTVDASLWFIHAVGRLHDHEPAMVDAPLLSACRGIIGAYQGGTDFGIRMDRDGLIAAGSPQTQLTWMDAQRDGVTFTPRDGKAIEICSLWHHALLTLARLTPDEVEADQLRELAGFVAFSIQTKFWWPERTCCHDLLRYRDGEWFGDAALRPNQIFAVCLDPSPLTIEQQRAVVNVVRDRLRTPFGVRTLDPDHPNYRGRYEGDLMQRDAAYHQGTAWPWLLGPLGEAMLRVNGYNEESRCEVRAMLEPILAELDRGCIGQLAEVYDGDAPHRPSGCPAQAWSVAELRRLIALTESQH